MHDFVIKIVLLSIFGKLTTVATVASYHDGLMVPVKTHEDL